jgi:signal transduction histidine kinase
MHAPSASQITEVDALRLALRQARDDIATRDQFLALLSHELRSPMSGIQSWAYVLENTIGRDSAAPVLQALAGIKTGVQQQVKLIDDLLDATQVMAGRIELDLQPLHACSELDSAIEALREPLLAKQIVVEREYDELDVLATGDAKRLGQVMRHLLGNAIRFSAAGATVCLGVAQTADGVRLRVVDHGRGIGPERLAVLRGPAASETPLEGDAAPRSTGFKLTLSQRLISLQRGRLEISSAGIDRGAQFTVYLPPASA